MTYSQSSIFDTFSAQIIQKNTPIEDNLKGDLQEKDKERLGASYKRVESFMADNQWHSPQEIAEATETRIDSALRMVRYMKKYGWMIQKEYKGEGLYLYRAQ